MNTHVAGLADRFERPRMAAERRFGTDPGHEPALDGFGGSSEVDRRGVNLRWLGASVLTALTGAALIGGAIYVALQGETTFAELPERVTAAAPRAPGDDKGAPARKGDKLVRSEVVAVAKQSFRTAMTLRAGDREVIKVRPFVRIATNLSLTSGLYATDIPPFNPLRLFAEENVNERVVPEAAAEVTDAEVSVVKRDLAGAAVEASPAGLSDEDVAAQIEEERRAAAEAGRRPVLPLPAQLILSRTLRQPDVAPEALGFPKPIDSPFNSIEVRVVPENVTTLPKHELRPSDSPFEERDVALKRAETFEAALKANGATDAQIAGVVTALGGRARTAALAEGQRMRILFGPGARPGEPRQMVRVILFGERGIEGIAAVNDRGAFVSVTPPVEESQKKGPATPRETDEEGEEEGGVRLYDSLYETAMKHELPRQTVEELVRIFGYDVDFQRRVANGDSVEIFYTLDEENGGERPELLYASLSVGGEVRRVFRYQSDDGAVEFFDEAGRSLKKFLMRKPIAEGELRSGFGYRRHPILGYSKMHTGVDWANRIGTPIMAAGNGTVIKAEWDSGYGRRVEVQHTNGYVTAYNHMSRFGRGVTPGAKVRQGQIIGFVGNTGLSTGPHLHYEVIVNGRFVDPMKIRVPRGKELEGRALAEFKRQREQVDALMQKAGGSTRLPEAAALSPR
ncbi:MAG TPA: M23 family metallopeptidase [Beijerinckiaceae bacterium]|jgi:murein DD-endopeptidase MepM/ murein hydrolase activator NlpD